MPIGSFTCIVESWESLLAACEANRDRFPGIAPFLATLSGDLYGTKSAKARQEEAEEKRLAATRELNESLERGEEAARRLRGYIKACLGTRSELLTEFGIAPIRARRLVQADRPDKLQAPQP